MSWGQSTVSSSQLVDETSQSVSSFADATSSSSEEATSEEAKPLEFKKCSSSLHGACYMMAPANAVNIESKDENKSAPNLGFLRNAKLASHKDAEPWNFSMDITSVGGQMTAFAVPMPDTQAYGVEAWFRSPKCGNDQHPCGIVDFKDAISIMYSEGGKVTCSVRGAGAALELTAPKGTEVFKVACGSDGSQAWMWVDGVDALVSHPVAQATQKKLPSQSGSLIIGGSKGTQQEISDTVGGSIAMVRVWKSVQDLRGYIKKK